MCRDVGVLTLLARSSTWLARSISAQLDPPEETHRTLLAGVRGFCRMGGISDTDVFNCRRGVGQARPKAFQVEPGRWRWM